MKCVQFFVRDATWVVDNSGKDYLIARNQTVMEVVNPNDVRRITEC